MLNIYRLREHQVGARYWDENCTSKVMEINWDFIEPGGLINVTIFLRSKEASEYITLSWDYTGQTINPGAVLKASLTLAVTSNITGMRSFSFDIIIIGTG